MKLGRTLLSLAVALGLCVPAHASLGGHGNANPTVDPCISAPSVASAVGYCTETLLANTWNAGTVDQGLTNTAGFQWYYYPWFGNTPTNANTTLNGTNAVIGTGGNTYGATLTSITRNGTAFHGTAYGGGMYIEAQLSMLLPASNQTSGYIGANGWAQFWTDEIEHMVSNGSGGSYITGIPLAAWPGQTSTYLHYIEPDVMENFMGAYSGNLNQVDSTGHDWWATGPSGIQIQQATNIASLSGTQFTVGMLWVPATGSVQGYTKFYVNGALVQTILYDKYSYTITANGATGSGATAIPVNTVNAAALGTLAATDIVNGYNLYDVTTSTSLGTYNGTWSAGTLHTTGGTAGNIGNGDTLRLTPAPPPGTNGGSCSATWCMGQVDDAHLAINTGANNTYPITVYYVHVYQASSANNLSN